MRFHLGCDPEVFLLDQNNKFFSAIGTFGGSKDMPRVLEHLGSDAFAVQEDNVALEFNIPPSATSEEFNKNIKTIVNYLAEQAANDFNLKFSHDSACLFPEEFLNDPKALEFGCEPDYNAWSGKRNPRPKATDARLRSAGGHVHVGVHANLDRADKCRLGRLMDLHLGIPSVLMDDGTMRKELYGKAGAMRYKPYGMEYRTLSNFWVFSETLNQWVWDATERAVQEFEQGRDVLTLEEQIVGTINNNNKVLAAQIVSEHGLLVVP